MVFYEQELTSFAELAKRLRVLDQDSGLRLIGRSGGKRVLVFVTRFGQRYTAMTYGVRKGAVAPSRRLQTMEFDTVEGLERALKGLVSGRVRAWVY